MRFNNLLLFLIVAYFASSMVGCSRFLNEKKKDEEIIQLSDEKVKCLQGWPGLVRKMSEGQAAEGEIRSSFGCLSDAFTYFGERTRGSMTDAYTAMDLRKFFGKYFLGDRRKKPEENVSAEFAQAFLRLKQVLFGGSDQFVTKMELSRIVSLMRPLADEAVRLSPNLPLYLGLEEKTVDSSRLDEAIALLRESVQNLLVQVEISRSDYSFEECKELIAQLGQITQGSEPIEAFRQASEWVPVIQSVKVLFFGEQAQLQGSRDWKNALNTLIDLYGLGLRYRYIVQKSLFETPEQAEATIRIGDKLLNLLEHSHQMTTRGRIPFEQLDQVIDLALEKKLIKIPLKAETIKPLYRKILIDMMDPNRRETRALEHVHLATLHREFNLFRLNQAFMNSLGTGSVGSAELKQALERFDERAVMHELTREPMDQEALRKGWAKFRDLMSRPRPIAFDERGRTVILAEPSQLEWSWKARTRFNLMHLLARGFMLGYANSADPTTSFTSVKGMRRWYSDFKDFGRDINAFDPRSANSGPRSFQEASFFTFSGNGDDQLRIDELFEFISLLFSAGLQNANALRDHLESEKINLMYVSSSGFRCSLNEPDVFGLRMLEENCFRTELRKEFVAVFPNLPGLSAYVSSLNDEQWKTFYGYLMGAAKTKESVANRVDTSDLRTAVMILHYMEVLFTTYDTDRNEILSQEELLAAAPRFLPFLKKVSPVKNDTVVTEGFLALVYDGTKPGGFAMAKQGGQRLKEFFFPKATRNADRMNILRVFGNLKAELEANPLPEEE